SDKSLDEAILATFRRAGVDVEDQDLPPDERSKSLLEHVGGLAADGADSTKNESLAKDRRILKDRAIRRIQRVKARGNQRVERVGYLELGQVADGPIDAIHDRQPCGVKQHSDRLDGIQRHPFGTRQDRPDGTLR